MPLFTDVGLICKDSEEMGTRNDYKFLTRRNMCNHYKSAISDNFSVWPQISLERIEISKIWIKGDQPQTLLRWKKIGEL